MQTVIHYLAFLLTGVLLQAQNTVEVTITNFSNNDGKARVGLYNQEGEFLNKPFKAKDATIQNQKATVVFYDLPEGTYAVSMYHDEDNDGKMKMRMGMFPAEDYACSNNAKGFMGPPQWKDAQFEVKNGEVKAIAIKL
ncbi:MAG: DUF2141 domain-containing protein [Flavobacteriaceae bacterium]